MWKIFLIAGVVAVGFYAAKEKPAVELPEIPNTSAPVEVTIETVPESVIQGEPVMIQITGTSTVESITFDDEEVGVFEYKGRSSALVGIDLKALSRSYPIVATLSDGREVRKNLFVGERVIAEAPLGIPDNLGGDTPEGEQNVISNLARENAILASIPTSDSALWQDKFEFPIESVTVTDDYGYNRLTGASTISHKGTDFRAAVGTRVYAMNSGVVRLAREFVVYGKTVIIDHGLGVHTLYMHLSEIDVELGEEVKAGELIGRSGKTGYAEFPHLHISVKIDGVSIDPMKFLGLF